MKKIVFVENHSRGFLSNYTTILISFRNLVGRLNKSPENIFISSNMFSLYGNPKNWFDPSKVETEFIDVEYYDTVSYFDLSLWPTIEELNLQLYIKYFPYNCRIKKYLNEKILNINNCLGIHYRGTDHNHTDPVPFEVYYNYLCQNIEKYEQIFICTDEENVIEKFIDYLNKKFKFNNVIYNNTAKCSSQVGLHNQSYISPIEKIALGDEVLLDSHSLSKCDAIIGKTSNVINYSRILNPYLKVNYLDKNPLC